MKLPVLYVGQHFIGIFVVKNYIVNKINFPCELIIYMGYEYRYLNFRVFGFYRLAKR